MIDAIVNTILKEGGLAWAVVLIEGVALYYVLNKWAKSEEDHKADLREGLKNAEISSINVANILSNVLAILTDRKNNGNN